MSRKMSKAGLSLLKSFEGCSLSAYYDVKGYSIGYGHFGAKKGETITQKEANALLKQDVAIYENAVNKYGEIYDFSQNEFDALVDFSYNLGAGNLDKLLKNGKADRAHIKSHMILYNKAGGKINNSLIKRRAAELQLFEGSEPSKFYPAYAGTSLVLDAILQEIGAPYGTWKDRIPLAAANGINNYKGTYQQNFTLIRLAKKGTLRRI